MSEATIIAISDEFGSGHWTDGGNAVTNFSIERFHIYREAIRRHGSEDLYIGKPTSRGSPEWFALRTRNPGADLSRFWLVFDQVKAEEAAAIAAARRAA